MNSLQRRTLCKLLNTSLLLPKYPPGGRGAPTPEAASIGTVTCVTRIPSKRMTDLPENLFENPVWHALRTKHRHFAVSRGEACPYPAYVAPFAAVSTPSESALHSLHSLLVPGEYVWLIGESLPFVPELSCTGNLECLQMVLPEEITLPGPIPEIVHLTGANAPEMVALTTLAFPGFFRDRTCQMGSYYGVRSGGELIAMGGERLTLDGFPESTGVCQAPANRREQ